MLQMSAMKACFQIAECSKSSAKVMKIMEKRWKIRKKVPISGAKSCFFKHFSHHYVELFCILEGRCRRQPVPFLLQAASAPGKQPVRYRERKSGRANHGSIGLHQRHDGYLCLRYLSEDQRNKSADSIETKQAFLIFLRKSVLNKER